MPCNGVTVMTYLRETQAAAVAEMVEAFALMGMQATPRITDEAGTIKFFVGLPGLRPGEIVPLKVAVTLNGAVTLVTEGGTFAWGKEQLEQMIVERLKARGVNTTGVKFEQHIHDARRAPRLRYTEPLRG